MLFAIIFRNGIESDLYRSNIFFAKMNKLFSNILSLNKSFIIKDLTVYLIQKENDLYISNKEENISKGTFYYDRDSRLLKVTWDFPLYMLLKKILKDNV